MKTKIIPFDLETTKKIQAGEIEGRIISNNEVAEILSFDVYYANQRLVVAKTKDYAGAYSVRLYTEFGKDFESSIFYELKFEVPDNEPQFKPFDRVLVRVKPQYADNNAESDYWCPAIFQNYSNTDAFKDMPYHASGSYWNECLPYEGNKHLVGTTNNPKWVMLTHEEEIKIKLKLFQSIADNVDKLCDANHYFTPVNVAIHVNNVYDELFNKPKEK